MEKVFSIKKWYEACNWREGGLSLEEATCEHEWTKKCEGKTKEEMSKMGYLYCDGWFDEPEQIPENAGNKQSQAEQIIDYMQKYGSITPIEALEELGCMRLAARISDIKRMGYNIKVETIERVNKMGETKRFARYSFE